MLNPNQNGYQITIYKSGAYDQVVNFNEWDTIRTVFQRAGIDYEEWCLVKNGIEDAYFPDSTLQASDDGAMLEIATKQIKQG